MEDACSTNGDVPEAPEQARSWAQKRVDEDSDLRAELLRIVLDFI